MSSVFLHVGQCGNQIGEHFWQIVKSDPACINSTAYSHGGSRHFRSIYIDSEPKVLKRILSEDKAGNIRGRNVIHTNRGRGNNWAMGYHGLKQAKDQDLVTVSLEAIRKEVERCEAFSGFIVVHSLSGGTGSGLGSRLCEALRDDYHLEYMMSCVVAPHASGESSLQHYNSLLCLNALNKYCDAVVMLQNDEVLRRLLKPKHSDLDTSVSFQQMNKHIATCMAGVFLPTDSLTLSGSPIGMEPWEMLRSVAPMPSLKFLNFNTVTRSKLSWENLAVNLGKGYHKYNAEGKPSTISGVVVARGDKTSTFPCSVAKVTDKLTPVFNPVSWNPFPLDFWTAKHNSLPGPGDGSSMTASVNSSQIMDTLEHIWLRARQKYTAKAFLHWYWKYGAEESDFEEAFESAETVVQNYHDAVR